MSNRTSMSLTDLRTVHSRARTAWEVLDQKRQDHALGLQGYIDREEAKYQKSYDENNARRRANPTHYNSSPKAPWWTRDGIAKGYPSWTAEDERALEKLDQVVRLLDEYALPKKQVYGGAAV